MKARTERRLAESEIVEAKPLDSSKMQIAIYTRVSTDRQEAENQAVELRRFAKKQNWRVIREYVDYESGSKGDRAQFQQMFRDASQRKFDCLLFWSLDRFSREGTLPTLRHLERLTASGIEWKSFTEQFFDSCGPFRDAIISIMATLARQERIRISERTKAGLAIARARGKTLGRPRREIDVQRIKRLRRAGNSWRQVAKALGASTATCVYRVRKRAR